MERFLLVALVVASSFASILLCCSALAFSPSPSDLTLVNPPTVNDIVTATMKNAELQRQRLLAYTVVRRYTVRNRHLKRDAVIEALWTYTPGNGERYKVISTQTSSGLVARSIRKLLETQEKNSRLSEDPSRISPDNYSFALDGVKPEAYILRLKPKHRSKYLLHGTAAVHKSEHAIIHVEGRTAARLSFWVGEADIVEEFRNYGGFWLPSKNRSTVGIRFVGKTELTIEAGEYRFADQR